MTVHVHGDYEWIEEPGHDSRSLEWVRVCECGYSPDRPQWRVLVTGSRNYPKNETIFAALDRELEYAERVGVPMTVVEGQCPHGGADLAAEAWAKSTAFGGHHVYHDPFPANWKELGKRAGVIRNQRMVDARANICLAFPTIESRGTWDCVRRAKEAGIPVKVFEE